MGWKYEQMNETKERTYERKDENHMPLSINAGGIIIANRLNGYQHTNISCKTYSTTFKLHNSKEIINIQTKIQAIVYQKLQQASFRKEVVVLQRLKVFSMYSSSFHLTCPNSISFMIKWSQGTTEFT